MYSCELLRIENNSFLIEITSAKYIDDVLIFVSDISNQSRIYRIYLQHKYIIYATTLNIV